MTTATLEHVSPVMEWSDDDDVSTWTTPGMAAGGVAWGVLTHNKRYAPDLALILKLPAPAALSDAEDGDLYSFVWDLVSEAARIGYTYAKIEPGASEAARWKPAGGRFVSLKALSRSVAAILGSELLEDDRDRPE